MLSFLLWYLLQIRPPTANFLGLRWGSYWKNITQVDTEDTGGKRTWFNFSNWVESLTSSDTLTNYEVNLSLDYTTITKDDTLKMRATQQDVNTESLTYQVESTNQITLYPYKTPTVPAPILTGGGVNEPPTATQVAPTPYGWNIQSVSLEAFNGTTMVHSAEVTDDGAALRDAGVLCSPNQSDGTEETTTTVVNTAFDEGILPTGWIKYQTEGDGWEFEQLPHEDHTPYRYFLPANVRDGSKGFAMIDNTGGDRGSDWKTHR